MIQFAIPGRNEKSRRHGARKLVRFLTVVSVCWFGLPLQADGAPAESGPVVFDLDPGRTEGAISPLLFGHNLEHTRRAIWTGLSAQMIANRKFAGESLTDSRANYSSHGFIGNIRTQGRPDPNGVAAHWYGIGKAGTSFYVDREIVFAGNTSQRIDVFQKEYPGGIGQENVSVEAGEEYEIRLWLRTHFEMKAHFRICDRTGRKLYLERSETWPGNRWHLWSFTWTAPESDGGARLEITFDGLGSAWLGAVSMMPAGNFRGMRRDVIALLQEMSVPWLRWPGGNFTRNFRWKDGLPPVDRRPPTVSGYYQSLPFTDNYDFQEIGIDEFLALCGELQAEPAVVLNITDSAESAAELVEYCNGSTATEWGKVRAGRGHPEPYGVKIWSVGNEIFGPWMGPAQLPATEYSGQIARFADALRKVDPSIIIVGCGIGEVNGWNRDVAAGAGACLDLISCHDYGPASGPVIDRQTLDQGRHPTLRMKKLLTGIRAEIDGAAPPGKPIPLTFDEWNVWHWWFVQPFEREWHTGPTDGMYVASALNMLCREKDRLNLHSAAFFQPVNEGCIAVGPHSAHLTAAGRVFKLFRAHHGNLLLAAPIPEGDEDIDLCASISGDGKRLVATVLNRNPERERAVALKLPGEKRIKSASTTILTPGDLSDPDAVFAETDGRVKTSGGTVSVTLPKYTIALVKIDL